MRFLSFVMIPILFISGCATARDSVLLGIGAGSIVGAGFGAAVSGPEHKNPAISTAVGAAIGATIGGLSGLLEYQRGNSLSQSQSKLPSSSEEPTLTMPEVRRLWVPSKLEENKFVTGHWLYLLEKQSTFRLDDQTSPAGDRKDDR